MQRISALWVAVVTAALLAACSGGGGGGGTNYNPSGTPTTSPTSAPTTSSQQVIRLALPQSEMGQETDPTFGLVGGFSQQIYSQVLGFAPGAQVMITNAQTSTPHTLGDTGGNGSFPGSASLSTTAAGGNTFARGYQSGTIQPGQSVGPVTLTAGTYWIGCAFHYASNTMRTVLVVSASAAPGPQATPQPGQATPDPRGPIY